MKTEKKSQKTNILVLDAGARGNAIVMAIEKSRHANNINLFVAPGNAGTNGISKVVPELAVSGNEIGFKQIEEFTQEHDIHFVIPGGEELLCGGIGDYVSIRQYLSKRTKVIGPNQIAAMLEGSKSFSKRFMKYWKIPTAKYEVFDDYESACNYVTSVNNYPLVIKADGLAAGKGVVIVSSIKEALQTIMDFMLNGKYEGAGKKVVIEEFLKGTELSVFIAIDANYNYVILPTAQDYKKLGDGNKGPNTGGMGAISPALNADAAFMEKVVKKIIEPTIEGLKADRSFFYKGFLFFGLMRVGDEPFLLEYNCRLGDPETVVILPRIASDFVDLIYAISENKLDEYKLIERNTFTACVAVVAEGYPGSFEKGNIITFPEKLEKGKIVFAGAKINKMGRFVTNGGRVAQVFAESQTLEGALSCIYNKILPNVHFDGMFYRKDIGGDYQLVIPQPFYS